MNYFWLDTNAIVKQYVTEKRGTPLINYLFTRVSLDRIFCLSDSIDETYRVFVKERNGERITIRAFDQAMDQFEGEFISRTEIKKVTAIDNQKTAARQFIKTYPIDHTDAYILRCALDKADELRIAGDDIVLVSSDKKLLKAARTERLLTFDPENDTQTGLDALINS